MTEPANTVSRRSLGLYAAGIAAAAALPGIAHAQEPARAELTEGDWMRQVQAQHAEIDRLFARIEGARGGERERAFKQVKLLLSAHAYAEDTVIYPGLASHGDRPEAKHLYDEQDDAKILLDELDNTPVDSPVWSEKFRSLTTAVRAHVREEEDRDFPQLLRRASPDINKKMSGEFRRNFAKAAAV